MRKIILKRKEDKNGNGKKEFVKQNLLSAYYVPDIFLEILQ